MMMAVVAMSNMLFQTTGKAVRATILAIARQGMVFIPCKKGISHNPLESATLESILDGADVLWEYVKGIE